MKLKNRFFLILSGLLITVSACKKKSEDPKPSNSGQIGQQPDKQEKIQAPESRPSTGNGTVRQTPVEIAVENKTIEVGEARVMSQRMADSSKATLEQLLGPGNQLRAEDNSTDAKYYGWFIHDLTFNGEVYSGYEQMQELDLAKVFFFNIDEPGYYWVYDYKSENWEYGTWAVDDKMQFCAFNVETDGSMDNWWRIMKASDDRFVIKLNKDLDGDGRADEATVGMNGYHLFNDEYNGDVNLSETESQFTGSWSYTRVTSEDGTVEYNFNPTRVSFNETGQGQTVSETPNGTETTDFSWIIEETGQPGHVYIYSYYFKNGEEHYDMFQCLIDQGNMVFQLIQSSNPENIGSEQYLFYMTKNQ